MIEVKVRSADACTVKSETLTSGRVGVMTHFNFSEEWEGLDRVAVFSNGVTDIDVYLESDTVPVPPEMFREAGRSVKVGVRGDHIEGDVVTVVIPTVYTLLGTVFNGTDISGNASADITPSLADQIMAAAQNAVDTANSVREDADTGVFDGVDGFSPTVAVTDIEGGHRVTITDEDGEHAFDVLDGQGGGGTGDHNQLTNRDAVNQHPMIAITGLQAALDGKQPAGDYATSGELDALADIVDAKQDTITDLSTIRSGAALGATALQSVPDEYVTETELNAHHDTTKQDALTPGENISIVDNVISATGGGGGFYAGPEAPEDTSLLWVDTDDATEDGSGYDMIVEINQIQGSSDFQPRITYGSAQDLIAKLEASDNYAPRVLIKSEIYYGTILTRSKQIASPSLSYYTNDTQISLVFHWVFTSTQCCIYISSDGRFGIDVVWLRTN